jgi:hypothetical protein
MARGSSPAVKLTGLCHGSLGGEHCVQDGCPGAVELGMSITLCCTGWSSIVDDGSSTERLHMGQRCCLLSQSVMQALWYLWKQGRTLSVSPWLYSDQQIAQMSSSCCCCCCSLCWCCFCCCFCA